MTFECPKGSICSHSVMNSTLKGEGNTNVTPQAGYANPTFNRPKGEIIKHITSTAVTQGSDNRINGGKTTLYVKDVTNQTENYLPTAYSEDGGTSWKFDGMEGIATDAMKASLNSEKGVLKRNVNQQTNQTLRKAGISQQDINESDIVANQQNKGNDKDSEKDPEPSTEATKFDSGVDRDNTRTRFGNYRYPLGMKETTQDILKIDMMRYEKQSIGEGGNFGSTGRRAFSEDNNAQGKRSSIGSVTLNIPGGIKDANKVNWGEDSMNAIQMAAAQVAIEAIKKGGSGAGEAIDKIGENMKSAMKVGGGNIKNGITAFFTAAAVGKDFSKLMSRTEGQIMNPNMELLFNGPTLRPFSFTFLLAPRSKKEAKEVIQIIRFFKQGMAPIRSKANLFLKAPHTFNLQYKHKGQNHQYLNRFKECALTACEVDYTPEQSYSTYEDGVMTAYSLSLSFTELEPIYNDDYENTDETSASSLTGGAEWDLVGDYSDLGGGPGQAPASIEIGF